MTRAARDPQRTWRWCQRCETHFDTALNHDHEDDMPRQTFIPGTEPPARNENIELAIERWYEAKQAQREAADTTAVRAASMLEVMLDAGVERYAFLEPETGKRKMLDAAAVRRARVKKAPSAKQEAIDREFSEASAGEQADVVKRLVKASGDEPVVVDPAARLLKPGQRRVRGSKAKP